MLQQKWSYGAKKQISKNKHQQHLHLLKHHFLNRKSYTINIKF